MADELRSRVKAQGEKIRIMKRDGAAPGDITAEVQALAMLKEELKIAAEPAKWKIDKTELDDVLVQRMFVVPGFEIYNGVAGLFDLGPPGCAMKENLLTLWRQHFVLAQRMLPIECTTLTPYNVLEASGHVALFADKMVKDLSTGECFRADKLLEDHIELMIKKDPMMSTERREELERIARQADALPISELHAQFGALDIKSPSTGNVLSEPFPFNLMFQTSIGPAGNTPGFLRPETAQGIFVNFKRLLAYNGGRLPFAAAQIGLAFRNEIAPRNGLLRVREFTMGEIEHFVDPEDKSHPRLASVAHEVLTLFTAEGQIGDGKTIDMAAGEAAAKKVINNETLTYFMTRTQQFLLKAGVNRAGLRFRQHLPSERAHYASDCWDAEILMTCGWVECVGHADRACYDLDVHAKRTHVAMTAQRRLAEPKLVTVATAKVNKSAIGKSLKAEAAGLIAALELVAETPADARELEARLAADGHAEVDVQGTFRSVTRDMVSYTLTERLESTEAFLPAVIEPSFGIGRIMTGILEHCFSIRESSDGRRRVLSFPACIAPVKCSVLPLDTRVDCASVAAVGEVLSALNLSFIIDDSNNSIGRRYARADEIGIPFAVTVEHATRLTGVVTLRDRDSCAQVRVPVADLASLVQQLCEHRVEFSSLLCRYEAQEKSGLVAMEGLD